jgi:D-sedoheptulose 7-phosphate isomerase
MTEATDFLYPFIEGDERDETMLLLDLAASARAKYHESHRVSAAAVAGNRAELQAAATAIAARVRTGGRLFTFGNGGSASDAALAAARFATPSTGTPIAARCLADDPDVLTALGNDIGFDNVFARQLIAHSLPGDIALGISTSGSSRNVLEGFEEAGRRAVLAIGIAGYDGGSMTAAGLDHCLVVRHDSVHRIQEAQGALVGELWARVQAELKW